MAKLDHRCREEAAFTLLELMVVVSVISFLSILILPSVRSARSYALTTKCIEGQRLIWAAVNRYEMDFNTTLFTIRNNGATIRDTLVNATYVEDKDPFECPASAIKDWDDITLTYSGIDFQNTYCTIFPATHLLQ